MCGRRSPVRGKPDIALSDLAREVKKSSTSLITVSRWVKGRFSWQAGFGAFSYSRSSLDEVIRYIERQDQHHTRQSFKDEYMRLLRRFGVAFDERYVFDFADQEALGGTESSRPEHITPLGEFAVAAQSTNIPPLRGGTQQISSQDSARAVNSSKVPCLYRCYSLSPSQSCPYSLV